MITPEGYSKDPGLIPEAIVITLGQEMIAEKGGLLSFIRWFENGFGGDGWWYHKCKNKPAHDILWVYVIVCNRLRYRFNYAGYNKMAQAMGYKHPDDQEPTMIEWPHIILTGPMVKCPFKRKISGFRQFRYATKLF